MSVKNYQIRANQDYYSLYDELNHNNYDMVVLQFSGEKCPRCVQISPFIKEIAIEYPNILFLYLDKEHNKEIVKQLGIMGIPHFVIFNKVEIQKEIVWVENLKKTIESIKSNLNSLLEPAKPKPAKVTLLNAPSIYKPFHYPWAYEAWSMQQKMHWIAEEVNMCDDVKDWKAKLNDDERNFLTQIFRFFTQADIEVNGAYTKLYPQVFQPTEVLMMLSAFSNIETIHIDSYAKLIDTIGMPEVEYSAFLNYKEMKDKYEYMHNFNVKDVFNIALTLAGYSAFTEGLQLFASFAMLLNFQRFNKMKGMCQIVAFSIRDESLHCESMIKLFHCFVEENRDEIDGSLLEKKIYQICDDIVRMEDAFIDLAFNGCKMEGMTAEEVKKYIRFIANKRLKQLGYNTVYDVSKNPFPWIDEMVNGVEFVNFFENRATEYSKGATKGDWNDVFDD